MTIIIVILIANRIMTSMEKCNLPLQYPVLREFCGFSKLQLPPAHVASVHSIKWHPPPAQVGWYDRKNLQAPVDSKWIRNKEGREVYEIPFDGKKMLLQKIQSIPTSWTVCLNIYTIWVHTHSSDAGLGTRRRNSFYINIIKSTMYYWAREENCQT